MMPRGEATSSGRMPWAARSEAYEAARRQALHHAIGRRLLVQAGDDLDENLFESSISLIWGKHMLWTRRNVARLWI
jgi:hypothetical protein